MTSLENLSLVDAAASIRNGSLSPVAYAEALLARMDAVEPRVRAWVTVDRDAVMAEARSCESEAKAGRFRGALHGIPIGVKDIYYTKGMRTTMGAAPFQNFI